MGQYHIVINLDKKEYIKPHMCGDGAKLLEFGASGEGVMFCLALLLAKDNGRGGGDASGDNQLIGSWAGDRIIISGDYGDKNQPPAEGSDLKRSLYRIAHDEYKNISAEIFALSQIV